MVAVPQVSKQRKIIMDNAQFESIRTDLFTAVIGDVLDTMGYRNQFLPVGLAP